MVIRVLLANLLRSYRDVRWVTNGAAALDAQSSGADRQVDHVVPVAVLVDRLLSGDEPSAVLAASGQCYVTKAEHHSPDGLAMFRVRHVDLLEQMRLCELGELLELGWKRYERAGIVWAPLGPHSSPVGLAS